jgi:hypothetical protein
MDAKSGTTPFERFDLLDAERLPAYRDRQGFDRAAWFLLAGAILFAVMVTTAYLLQQEGESLVVTTWRD